SNPTANPPVRSFKEPISSGPKYPPATPMVFMKARPEAAPRPVMKRVGMLQKTARAEVMPMRAMVSPVSATAKLADSTEITSPAAPKNQAVARLRIFLPLLSTRNDHQIIAAVAQA